MQGLARSMSHLFDWLAAALQGFGAFCAPKLRPTSPNPASALPSVDVYAAMCQHTCRLNLFINMLITPSPLCIGTGEEQQSVSRQATDAERHLHQIFQICRHWIPLVAIQHTAFIFKVCVPPGIYNTILYTDGLYILYLSI